MLKVEKLRNYYANLSVDGDKSLTVRAIILGALASGETVVENPLICADTLATVSCVKTMGATVLNDEKNNRLVITGARKIKDGGVYDCKNSGTTARLLIGALAGLNVNATVIGDKSLSRRPMQRIIEPLKSRGAKIESANGTLPVKIYPAELFNFVYKMPIDSAQVKSGILLSGVTSKKRTEIIENNKTRPHTEELLKLFDADIIVDDKKITLNGQNAGENINEKFALEGHKIVVPSDPSSAAFYVALGLLCGEVTVPKVPLIDTRAGFYKILQKAGAQIFCENEQFEDGQQTFDVTARKGKINYFEIEREELPSLIDELPLISAIAAKNGGAKIKGACELKFKESDRLNGTCALINAAGGCASVTGGDLIILPKFTPANFEYSSDDHRMIMTAFVLMSAGAGGVLFNEDCVFVSFPNFFKNLNNFKCALFGENVENSFSGAIHKFVLSAFGLKNFSYEQISCGAEEFLKQLEKPAYRLINATYPYKNKLFSAAEKTEKNVEFIQNANFLFGGVAYSTDGDGLLYALLYSGCNVKEKNVLIIGAGGAGKSICYSFAKAGACVYVFNRTAEKAKSFSKECLKQGINVLPYVLNKSGEIADSETTNNENENISKKKSNESPNKRFDIIINAAPVGNPQGLSDEIFKGASVAVDVNYKKPSEFLKKAKSLGAKTLSGESMLFFQGYLFDCVICKKNPSIIEGTRLFAEFKQKYARLFNALI